MKEKIIDILFPKICLGCNQVGDLLCQNCFKQIPINQKTILKTNHLRPLSKIFVASEYDHFLVKKVIHNCKYNFISELANPLAEILFNKLKQINLSPKTILIPTPLHLKRLKWRGFNQSQLIAQRLSQKLNFDFTDQLLIKSKNTKPQVKLKGPEARQKNLKQAFKLSQAALVNKKQFDNKTFLLIDDVLTTGTTLQECAKTLNQLNPKQIQAAVIAHAE